MGAAQRRACRWGWVPVGREASFQERLGVTEPQNPTRVPPLSDRMSCPDELVVPAVAIGYAWQCPPLPQEVLRKHGDIGGFVALPSFLTRRTTV